jgi:hypothetical protein
MNVSVLHDLIRYRFPTLSEVPLEYFQNIFFYGLEMLALRPNHLLFLGLGPARNQELGSRMSYIILTSTSFKNLNYVCNNLVMLVAKILDKFKVYFNGVLKYSVCTN